MSDTTVIHIVQQAIILVVILSAPVIFTSLIVGFIAALLMTITSIQEQTLSFVPKTLAVFGVLLAVGPLLLSTVVNYFTRLWSSIPDLLKH